MIQVRLTADQLCAGRVGQLVVELGNTGPGPCTNIVFKLDLPDEVVVLGGSVRVHESKLSEGASITRVLRVRPEAEGTWVARSSNFSYRDARGNAVRETDFHAEFAVWPRRAVAAPPEPQFGVELVSRELTCGEWDVLRGRITNTGVPVLVNLSVSVTGALQIYDRTAHQSLGTLPPGETAEFAMHVHPGSSGAEVPVQIRVNCTTDAGRASSREHIIPVRVHKSPPPAAPSDPIRILYLSSSPRDLQPLRVDAESRTIAETMRLGEGRDGFKLYQYGAVRTRDISQRLLEVRPHIVHFSGHSAADGTFQVENEVGRAMPVPVDGLAALFGEVTDTVRCVIVNACDSTPLAKALAEHIDYVIGMKESISDPAAIAFSLGFYQALVAGRPVEKAFNFATRHIQLQPYVGGENSTPELFRRAG